MATSQRVQRVSDEIQKVLASLIQRSMKDPRVGFVTVSSVSVSKDLSFADIRLSWLDLEEASDCLQALEVIQNASGFLRTQLAKELRLRVMPKLRFHHDSSLVEGARLNQLIDQVLLF